jgi:hypothetical protein
MKRLVSFSRGTHGQGVGGSNLLAPTNFKTIAPTIGGYPTQRTSLKMPFSSATLLGGREHERDNHKGYPHGMITAHADSINRGLLAFVRG